MRRFLLLLFVLGGFWVAYQDWRLRELSQPPGVLVADVPEQAELEQARSFRVGDYALDALARYRIRARLLGREPYRWDAGSDLAPLDFALGWGPMSDSQVLSQLEISQGGRFYRWRYEGQPPVPVEQIIRSSANTHLIPADDGVARALDKMRPGQLVELSGYLVAARRTDGFTWKSSLRREDTGAGACELLWVESASVI